ncbi:LysR family transcriptional regulator [Altererythrobacter sp. FM1]|uniref:LysR family transcriptional regulator n=1 Tax=Tsuneonella flava TaxID=2055955 RepID=UPI000C801964|nr:LysR family transcriptional regulator [Tsuneonella flava]ROT93422.1 LysR family transcriptional regulator [Altererythrobacter sp. FM1]
MAINLTHLRTFWAVATCGGFAPAARFLGVGQPTLTRQIKELEEGYRIVLINRQSRTKTLTPEGELLLPIVRKVFENVNQAETFLKQYATTNLRIGTVTTIATSKVIDLLKTSAPDAKVAISMGPSEYVRSLLLEEKCDIGILTLSGEHDALETVEIGRYPLLAIFPPWHPLLEKDEVSILDLADEPIVAGSSAAQTRLIIDELARQRGFALNIVQEVDEPKMIIEMVRVGFGVGVMGYTGIAEQGIKMVRQITDTRELIPVHIACLKVNRRARLTNQILSLVQYNRSGFSVQALEDFSAQSLR